MKGLQISFCVPTYRLDEFKYAIESILALTNLNKVNYEILVSDDSTDEKVINERKSFLNSKDNKNIRYIQNKNHGQFNNLNNLYKNAKYGWIIFLHDDDSLETEYLTRLIEAYEKKSQVEIIYFGRYLRDSAHKIVYEGIYKDNNDLYFTVKGSEYIDYLYLTGDSSYKQKMIAPMVTGLAIKKGLIEKAGKFSTELEVNSDWLFLMRTFSMAEGITYVNEPLVNYTLNEVSERALPSQSGVVFEELVKIFKLINTHFKKYDIIDDYDNKYKIYHHTFYKKCCHLNGPLLWIALRFKNGYLNRLKLQISISYKILFDCPKIWIYPKFYLVFVIGLFPQFILNYMYQYYIQNLYNRQI